MYLLLLHLLLLLPYLLLLLHVLRLHEYGLLLADQLLSRLLLLNLQQARG
jgi:hypothetical protein